MTNQNVFFYEMLFLVIASAIMFAVSVHVNSVGWSIYNALCVIGSSVLTGLAWEKG